MTIRSGFFNAIEDDRVYDAAFFAEYFATFIGNGIFVNPSTSLQVYSNENLTTKVSIGKGWINGYFIINDSDYILTHDRADGALKRIDRIVMQLDHHKRTIEIVIKKGAFASTPIAPTLVRNGDLYELALADVSINNGATQITQAHITDQRLNKSLCGIVHGLVEQVDTTTIFNQYQAWLEEYKGINAAEWEAWQNQEKADFEAWLDSIKDLLDDNVAAKLAAQITAVDAKLDRHIVEENVHGIGDKNALVTPDKTTIVGAINSHVHDYIKHPAYAVTTGTNAYSVTLNSKPTKLEEGMGIVMKVGTNATANCTLNVNGMGAKAIMSPDGIPITDLKSGGVYTVRYNGTNFILQGEGGKAKFERVNSRLLGNTLKTLPMFEIFKTSNDDFLYGSPYRYFATLPGKINKYDKRTGMLIKSHTFETTSNGGGAVNVTYDNDKIYLIDTYLYGNKIRIYNDNKVLLREIIVTDTSNITEVRQGRTDEELALLRFGERLDLYTIGMVFIKQVIDRCGYISTITTYHGKEKIEAFATFELGTSVGYLDTQGYNGIFRLKTPDDVSSYSLVSSWFQSYMSGK